MAKLLVLLAACLLATANAKIFGGGQAEFGGEAGHLGEF